ncbi:hypothetical protein KPP03845_100140 [Streptomyces xanthophaeus]|uniref:hypothetical protein n=1 Tax=Streptomyces xanthophaeus TaxID=67385 RepID=UPI00233F0BB6|nr:hypothetical protein [Streptomyces xanthophaeus]WCD83821.1 hypothetical protein KPP03845_100140 [Streptomyces xanthophaeus]
MRRSQHDYLVLQVELLVQVRPHPDQTDARLTVHSAPGVVNGVLRMARFRERPRLAEEWTGFARVLPAGR